VTDSINRPQFDAPPNLRRPWEIVAAFCFGVVFLTTILTTALFKPDPTPYQYTVFRIILALAAAGIGAILPGFFEIKNKIISAGGALALFLVVFYGAPAALSPVLKEPEEISDNSQPIIDKWFVAMDSGNLRAAYDQTSTRFQNQYTYEQFKQLTSQYMGPLGATQGRKLYSTSFAQSPPGSPVGRYQYNMYETTFEKFAKPLYMNVTVIGENGNWKVFGYALAARNEQGMFIPFDPTMISTKR
jgi:Protein of unknown function (DUF4019)